MKHGSFGLAVLPFVLLFGLFTALCVQATGQQECKELFSRGRLTEDDCVNGFAAFFCQEACSSYHNITSFNITLPSPSVSVSIFPSVSSSISSSMTSSASTTESPSSTYSASASATDSASASATDSASASATDSASASATDSASASYSTSNSPSAAAAAAPPTSTASASASASASVSLTTSETPSPSFVESPPATVSLSTSASRKASVGPTPTPTSLNVASKSYATISLVLFGSVIGAGILLLVCSRLRRRKFPKKSIIPTSAPTRKDMTGSDDAHDVSGNQDQDIELPAITEDNAGPSTKPNNTPKQSNKPDQTRRSRVTNPAAITLPTIPTAAASTTAPFNSSPAFNPHAPTAFNSTSLAPASATASSGWATFGSEQANPSSTSMFAQPPPQQGRRQQQQPHTQQQQQQPQQHDQTFSTWNPFPDSGSHDPWLQSGFNSTFGAPVPVPAPEPKLPDASASELKAHESSVKTLQMDLQDSDEPPVLYQDSLVRVVFKARYHKYQAKVAVLITNVSNQKLTQFEASMRESVGLQCAVKGVPAVELDANEETQLLLLVRCVEPFANPPLMDISFGARKHRIAVTLPLTCVSFVTPKPIDTNAIPEALSILSTGAIAEFVLPVAVFETTLTAICQKTRLYFVNLNHTTPSSDHTTMCASGELVCGGGITHAVMVQFLVNPSSRSTQVQVMAMQQQLADSVHLVLEHAVLLSLSHEYGL